MFLMGCNKTTQKSELAEGGRRRSLERLDEFEAEQTCIAHHVLPQDASDDRRRLTGNQTGRGRRRGWDRKLNRLIGSKDALTGNAGSKGADIKGFSKLDEFRTRGVRAAHKDGNLQADASRAPCRRNLQPFLLSWNAIRHELPAWYYGHSTVHKHLGCQRGLSETMITRLRRMPWRGFVGGKSMPPESKDSKIHWISANVQMERFYH